jgi:hypothetical protein
MTIPPKLYKYQRYSAYALESLIKKEIWVSDPAAFNDPFDCRVRLEDVTTQEQLDAISQALQTRWREDTPWQVTYNGTKHFRTEGESDHYFANRIRRSAGFALTALTKVGIYSLARKRDDLLMWGHYADHHRGFVIGFDATRLTNTERMQVVEVSMNMRRFVLPR